MIGLFVHQPAWSIFSVKLWQPPSGVLWTSSLQLLTYVFARSMHCMFSFSYKVLVSSCDPPFTLTIFYFYSKKLDIDNFDQMTYLTIFLDKCRRIIDKMSHRQNVTVDEMSYWRNDFRTKVVH